MNLILCCANASLQARWFSALSGLYTTFQATTLQDLRVLVGQKISFDLLIVHATLLDLDIVAYIRKRRPACKLFILSDRPDEAEGLHSLRLGVVGYANSYISPDRLQEATKAIASGSVWINQQLMQRLIAGTLRQNDAGLESSSQEKRPLLLQLSQREYQIARLVAEGLSNLEIAERLGITERTVKAHLGAAYAKTSARGRLGLALLVQQSGGTDSPE